MKEPLKLIGAHREFLLNMYRGVMRDRERKGNGPFGGFLRGMSLGYSLALRQARRLLRGIREKKRQGWHLVWVDSAMWRDFDKIHDMGGWHEAEID